MWRIKQYGLFGLTLAGMAYWQPAAADMLLGTPRRLDTPVNSSSRDESAVLSSDGLTMYFSSTRSGGRSLWEAKRESLASAWQSAVQVDGIDHAVSASTISQDGLELYFADGWAPFFGGNLWMSRRTSVDAAWSPLERLPATIDSRAQEDSPFLSPDGLSLYFGSTRSGGYGGNDIYVARRASVDDAWQPPVNLGPDINSSSNDWMGGISTDGLSLFYDSDRARGVGNYVATRTSLDDDFHDPVFFPPSVNVSADAWRMTPSPDGSTLYYSVGHGNGVDIWEVPVMPFDAISVSANGGNYQQSFDEALGADGSARGMRFPQGWTTSEDGGIFQNEITQRFPVGTSISSENTPVFNAGAEGDLDRALAIGVTSNSDTRFLQLLAEVANADATALQLSFDIEVWDVRRSRQDDPGEGAFDVTVEVDRGDGFTDLLNFGNVTTGASLTPPEGDYLDGNGAANSVTFDSGMQEVSVSAGSKLRIRWSVPDQAAATGWVYGLDNVELRLVEAIQAGDFDGNGMLDVADIDQLAQEVAAETHDPRFDLTDDNLVDQADLVNWVKDLKHTWLGDANLDGKFNSGDLVQVFQADTFEQDVEAGWAQGDWTGDRRFDSGDLVAALQDGGYALGARAALTAVPEPSSLMMLMAGSLGIMVWHLRRCW